MSAPANKHFAVFSPDTGEIVRSGVCAAGDLALQGEHVVEGAGSAATHYVVAGALVAYTAEQADAKRARPTLVHQWSNETFAWTDPRSEAEREQELADNARSQRDRLLAASDWIAIRAIERGDAMPEAWQTYRQALRDVPEQAGFPVAIDWPTLPA